MFEYTNKGIPSISELLKSACGTEIKIITIITIITVSELL